MYKKLILCVAIFASQVCFSQTPNPMLEKVEPTISSIPANNSTINKNNDAFIKDSADAFKPSGGSKHFLKSIFPSLEKYYDHQINKFLVSALFALVLVIYVLRRVMSKSKRSSV